MRDERQAMVLPAPPPNDATNQPVAGGGRHRFGAAALRRGMPLLAMACAVAVFWIAGFNRCLDLQAVIDNHEALLRYVEAHRVLAAAAFLAIYVACVSVSFPGASLLTVVGGFLFGTFAGGALAAVAATLGAVVIFFVARSSLGGGLARQAGPFLERFAAGFEKNAFLYLLSLRLAPIFPFWLVNLAPALVGIRFRDYFASTLLGIVPGTFAFAAVGGGFDGILDAQRAPYEACRAAGRPDCTLSLDPQALMTPAMLGALGALAVVSLIPVFVRAVRARA